MGGDLIFQINFNLFFKKKITILDGIHSLSLMKETLAYNSVKKCFFRVFLNPFDEEEDKPRIREREKWLLEYTSKGDLMSKTLIPRELEMQPLVMDDGTYWFPQRSSTEEYLEFAIYK